MRVDNDKTDIKDSLRQILNAQQAAQAVHPYPSIDKRKARLDALGNMIRQNENALIDAINADFGCRSRTETILAEVLGCYGSIHYARKNLRTWMRPRKRRTSFWSIPAKTYSMAQPLGVVGIMAPWNYSLHLCVAPLVAALAAGNRAMICMSEETPNLFELFSDLISTTFEKDEVTVFIGGAQTSPAFAALPFDHLLFTGSTRVGSLIAQAAAKNLTPVTLELGGKSPAIVAPDFPIKEAAQRIGWGKLFNAGQTCIAPDYVLVPEDKRDTFVTAVLDKFSHGYDGTGDPDYTAMVSERFYIRMTDLIEDARSKGAQILRPDGFNEIAENGIYKFPPTVVLDAPEDCVLLNEEIFGPILPILTYSNIDNVPKQIGIRDRPLSLYLFTHDQKIVKQMQQNTISGSFVLNDTLVQYAQEDLAFGGVGASGQGAYHGQEGFDTFSHLKSNLEQRGIAGFVGTKVFHPPYGKLARFCLKWMKR